MKNYKVCGYCKNKYPVKPSLLKTSKYCCKSCHTAANNKKRAIPVGGFGKWDGYITIKTIEGKRVMYHNYLMEKHLGKPIPKSYIVHHIDDNKHNNEITNLVLVTPSVHGKIHSMQKEKGLRKWHENRRVNS